MKQANLEQHNSKSIEPGINFYGASIVTASGEEIPITEQMLQRSFKVLIDAWENTHSAHKA